MPLMAKTTITRITDDIDGSGEAQTVTFGIEGRQHEIDLSSKNRKVDKALKPCTSREDLVGRLAGGSPGSDAIPSITDSPLGATAIHPRVVLTVDLNCTGTRTGSCAAARSTKDQFRMPPTREAQGLTVRTLGFAGQYVGG
jgi:hypothetical protein